VGLLFCQSLNLTTLARGGMFRDTHLDAIAESKGAMKFSEAWQNRLANDLCMGRVKDPGEKSGQIHECQISSKG
jgi:hypothetical protein